MSHDWRTPVDSGDYFLHRQKQADMEARRPSIRRASDLVGPGINASAVRITDYNNLLATFNGYYSSEPGAINAPNSTEAFVGYVISDLTLGGRQVFTGLTSGVEYSRTFNRSPEDPETLGWSAWSGQRIPATATGYDYRLSPIAPGWTQVILPPVCEITGDPEVYEVSDAGIRVLRQGVYTGSIQIGSNGPVLASPLVYTPNGDTTSVFGYLGTTVSPTTVFVPFTVTATDGAQGFSVAVTNLSGATQSFWYRFSCTRIGDAV